MYNQRHQFEKFGHGTLEDIDKYTPVVLKENDPCLHVKTKNTVEKPKTLIELYMQDKKFQRISQTYMGPAWKDFVFINSLKSHKVLKESTQNEYSFQNIHNAIDDCIEKTTKIYVI